MKIAFVGQKGIPMIHGGVEKHVEELSVHLAARGHNVLVYTRPNYTDKNLTNFKGVRLISLPSIATKHLDAAIHTFLVCLHIIIKERDVDIVHFHSIGPSLWIWLIKVFMPKTPVVATFHTKCYVHQKWGRLARFALKTGERSCCLLSDKVITISKGLHQYMLTEYKREPKYIPNGVSDMKLIPPAKIKQWGLDKNNYIVTVSRLVRHKGIHYLIEAYKQLETDKKLVIVGSTAYTDDYVRQLKKMAKGNDKIIFTGNQSGRTLKELFSNAYLFVQPSESEGLSIALLEAMAYRRGLLLSDIPENKEAAKHTAYYFQNKNINSLKEALKFLLSDQQLVSAMGERAQERVKKYYHWDNISKNVENLYENIINEKKSRLLIKREKLV